MKEYPVTIVKRGLFLVFLEINSFLAFKVLARILLESPKGGFYQGIPPILKRVGFGTNRVFYHNLISLSLMVKHVLGKDELRVQFSKGERYA